MTEFEIKIIVVEKTGKMFGGNASKAEHAWNVTSDFNAQKILRNVLDEGQKAKF